MQPTLLPVLYIHGPDGQTFEFELEKPRVTIGRFSQFNDIALEDDPQQLISRKVHCAVERDATGWWVVDNGSINRTFVQRQETMEVVHGRSTLADGDRICILGRLTEQGEPRYWQLAFSDPLGTKPVMSAPEVAYLEYDWVQARLFRVEGASRQAIKELRPQEHKLLRYMDQRNRANRNVPVMCSYEELLTALWGDEVDHTENEVNHLAWELRKKLEVDPKKPRFLQTVKGLGYRLETRPLPD